MLDREQRADEFQLVAISGIEIAVYRHRVEYLD